MYQLTILTHVSINYTYTCINTSHLLLGFCKLLSILCKYRQYILAWKPQCFTKNEPARKYNRDK